MHSQTVQYSDGETKFKGFLVYNDKIKSQRPAIIIAHAWHGQDQFVREKAKALAELGYVGFAADVYGDGKSVETNEEAQALMLPLFLDRQKLQNRIKAAYQLLKEHPLVDPSAIGGIGFCFGGLTIIELFRSGVDVKGVVSFHGVLGNVIQEAKAKTVPIAKNIKGSILVMHGYNDPLVSQQDIHHFEEEMTQANVDWQMHIYGHTYHAFTNPQAHDTKLGLFYNAVADKRSWLTMRNFFEEIFNK